MPVALTREARAVVAIAAASLAIRAAFAATSDIFQDEGFYWWTAYSRVSFSPHPPLLPLLVRCGMAILGHGVLGVRAGSLLWGTGAVVLSYLLGRDMYSRRTGL